MNISGDNTHVPDFTVYIDLMIFDDDFSIHRKCALYELFKIIY